MSKNRWKKLTSAHVVRKLFIIFCFLVLLFVAFNYFLIPLYVNAGGIETVPSVVGMAYDDAHHVLDSLGFEARKGDVRLDRDHPAGIVIIQNPVAGDSVKKGRRVYLTVSGGELLVSVPSIKGRTLRDARFALEKEGLRLGAIEYAASDQFPENTVIEQKVGAGAKVKRDVYVSVVVSQGSVAQKIAVPDVTGKTLAEASAIFQAAGLAVGNITYVPSADLLPNTIVDQYPRVGEMVATGQKVDLFVVQGAEKQKETLEN
ncbi:MAG TPA: PASTA domain-containing protein [Bacteroidota bacterium]|nr:PASTA domain-containing protein [Bacteroidota bacterium]